MSKLNDLTSAPDNVMKGNDRIETIFVMMNKFYKNDNTKIGRLITINKRQY